MHKTPASDSVDPAKLEPRRFLSAIPLLDEATHLPPNFMFSARQWTNTVKAIMPTRRTVLTRRSRSSRASVELAAVDEDGIPLRPTWSVNDLLSSYPKPTISPPTLRRMYELSALVPPAEGTAEHAKIIHELEDLVKLVEAVKLVDVDSDLTHNENAIPDGRIWAEGVGIPLERSKNTEVPIEEGERSQGRALLKHAQRTHNGFYVVDKSSRRG
ncbi:hypothetical protein BC835DRAFT_647678 [Cytidiella melzeri]|nr:hypothetical protein BC835DRAFT_647678 [Cytidiella melzeri]